MSPGASNLGPRSKVLLSNTQALVASWKGRGVNPTPDLVTTSGSGSTPISRRRRPGRDPNGVPGDRAVPGPLRALIASQDTGAQLGFLGSSYVNVLQLNEALAKLR